MSHFYSEKAKAHLAESPVLKDVSRFANFGDRLKIATVAKPFETIDGRFDGFTEVSGEVNILVRDKNNFMILVKPENVATLIANGGFYNDYRNRGRQGRPAGGNSI